MSKEISVVTAYEVNGMFFDSPEKARHYLERLEKEEKDAKRRDILRKFFQKLEQELGQEDWEFSVSLDEVTGYCVGNWDELGKLLHEC